MTLKELEIVTLAIEYIDAIEITRSRVDSEEFWNNADAGDIDEIDLEESLARSKLIRAVEAYRKENNV